MTKKFCDRCETEISKNDYVYFNMNVFGLDKHNNKYNKDAELCCQCAELILNILKKY